MRSRITKGIREGINAVILFYQRERSQERNSPAQAFCGRFAESKTQPAETVAPIRGTVAPARQGGRGLKRKV